MWRPFSVSPTRDLTPADIIRLRNKERPRVGLAKLRSAASTPSVPEQLQIAPQPRLEDYFLTNQSMDSSEDSYNGLSYEID